MMDSLGKTTRELSAGVFKPKPADSISASFLTVDVGFAAAFAVAFGGRRPAKTTSSDARSPNIFLSDKVTPTFLLSSH